MSLKTVPTEEEVMRWNAQRLADYMGKLKLSSCDEVVLRSNITGAQFMKMTHYEMKVFPGLYVPTLTSIQREIKRGVQTKDFGSKPYQNELQTTKEKRSDKPTGSHYMLPNFLQSPKPKKDAPVQDGRRALYSDIKMATIKKPELPVPGPPSRPMTNSKGSVVSLPRISCTMLPKPQAPKPPGMTNRVTSVPLIAGRPFQENTIPAPKQMTTQSSYMSTGKTHSPYLELDPRWYGGKVTRCLAEMVLRDMNKDGAFLVRDSSRSSTDHNYTLMILNKGKVYNIKICEQGNSYFLGNGVRNMQSFPGVMEIINHYTHTPLLLIDGRGQTTGEQPQCRLQHPVGF